MNFKEKVKELIDKGLEENPSLFLIDYTVGADNLIKVTIDGDNGVSIEDCVVLSRAIEHNLDREEQDFSLEVASCGIFAPLTQERQYVKNIGRDLQLKTNDLALEGNIKAVENGSVILEVSSREPKPIGKGKITVKKEYSIQINDIKEAKLLIKF